MKTDKNNYETGQVGFEAWYGR